MSQNVFEQVVTCVVTNEEPVTCLASTPVAAVLATMREHRIGCVIIGSLGTVDGIFTERDYLMKPLPEGTALNAVPISDLMVKNPMCLREDSTLKQAILMMRVGRFRHIPILDQKGRLKCVVSVRDIVNFVADAFSLQT